MTIKQKLLELLKEKKINQYVVDCILLEIDSNKPLSDLSKYEQDILKSYLVF
jgi:hypothetical protein